mmetsp:Transcript_1768/g.3521  ORF Transcript_1768/g.3521 Transcript_1768/m.3521 type:complete len:296 (-) Transcript_1768:1-888(-)
MALPACGGCGNEEPTLTGRRDFWGVAVAPDPSERLFCGVATLPKGSALQPAGGVGRDFPSILLARADWGRLPPELFSESPARLEALLLALGPPLGTPLGVSLLLESKCAATASRASSTQRASPGPAAAGGAGGKAAPAAAAAALRPRELRTQASCKPMVRSCSSSRRLRSRTLCSSAWRSACRCSRCRSRRRRAAPSRSADSSRSVRTRRPSLAETPAESQAASPRADCNSADHSLRRSCGATSSDQRTGAWSSVSSAEELPMSASQRKDVDAIPTSRSSALQAPTSKAQALLES